MGRRRVIGPASRSPGPARAFLLTLAVGLLLGLLLGFFLGRLVGGDGEGGAPPVPQARTVTLEKTVRAPEKSAAPETTATATPSASASASP